MHKMIRRRSVETWRELVARQARSGLSVQAFCQQERLNTWTFYGWRSRLRGRTATVASAAMSGSTEPEPTAGFIDLGALGGSSPRCEIRLELGGGVVLQVVRG
jgi:putative transposase